MIWRERWRERHSGKIKLLLIHLCLTLSCLLSITFTTFKAALLCCNKVPCLGSSSAELSIRSFKLGFVHFFFFMEEEFDEEEVWAMVRETKDDTLKSSKVKDASFYYSVKSSYASRNIPRSNNTVGEDNSSAAMTQQSAPVTIPNWSKIFEKGDKDDEEDDDEDRVPPHEWIAKKMERNQISSFSVCEGEGRTLKGRDQRKVRNAVLTRTGFLE